MTAYSLVSNEYVNELYAEIRALKTMLEKLQFDPTTNCCPYCGGNQHHDGSCEIAALLSPEKAEVYEAMTGMSIIAALNFDAENKGKIKTTFKGEVNA